MSFNTFSGSWIWQLSYQGHFAEQLNQTFWCQFLEHYLLIRRFHIIFVFFKGIGEIEVEHSDFDQRRLRRRMMPRNGSSFKTITSGEILMWQHLFIACACVDQPTQAVLDQRYSYSLGRRSQENNGKRIALHSRSQSLSALSGIHRSRHQAHSNHQLNQVVSALGTISACLLQQNDCWKKLIALRMRFSANHRDKA